MIQSGSSIFKVEPIFQHLTQCLSKNLKIDLEDISMIEKIINEAEHIYGRFLTDRSFTQLRNYFQLSLYRLRKSHYVEYGGEKNSKWEMAKGMIDRDSAVYRKRNTGHRSLLYSRCLKPNEIHQENDQ